MHAAHGYAGVYPLGAVLAIHPKSHECSLRWSVIESLCLSMCASSVCEAAGHVVAASEPVRVCCFACYGDLVRGLHRLLAAIFRYMRLCVSVCD